MLRNTFFFLLNNFYDFIIETSFVIFRFKRNGQNYKISFQIFLDYFVPIFPLHILYIYICLFVSSISMESRKEEGRKTPCFFNTKTYIYFYVGKQE